MKEYVVVSLPKDVVERLKELSPLSSVVSTSRLVLNAVVTYIQIRELERESENFNKEKR